jgi:putative ABC transport system permease protein
MLGYYIGLAARSVRRNVGPTCVMVAAVGVGVGAAMTLTTALRALSANPIPAKSSQLFSVRVDNWGPDAPNNARFSDLVSYTDAIALAGAQRATRQTAMYATQFSVTPAGGDANPFQVTARVTDRDFFQMFDAPFSAGGSWTDSDDRNRADVVVLGVRLAQRLYPTGNAVGRSVMLGEHGYRIVGVLKPWRFQPRVYDLSVGIFQETEDVFLPLSTAVARQIPSFGEIYCGHAVGTVFTDMLSSECRWLQLWVELPSAAAVSSYRRFLDNYAAEQRRIGRFSWPANVSLLDVADTQRAEHMVPNEIRVSTVAAFGFLVVCLVNATGLMLATLNRRAGEFSIRRAVGASKGQIFSQCLAEASVVGIGGGVLGLVLTGLGVAFERLILREDYARIVRLDPDAVFLTLALATISVAVAALYPAWNASRLQPAWKLKAE